MPRGKLGVELQKTVQNQICPGFPELSNRLGAECDRERPGNIRRMDPFFSFFSGPHQDHSRATSEPQSRHALLALYPPMVKKGRAGGTGRASMFSPREGGSGCLCGYLAVPPSQVCVRAEYVPDRNWRPRLERRSQIIIIIVHGGTVGSFT